MALAGRSRQSITTMDTISIRSVRALMRSLERIYSAEGLREFPPVVFSALGELFEGCLFSLDTLNLKTGEVISATSDNDRVSAEIKQRLVELLPTHPVIPIAQAGAKGAIRLSDCVTQRQFERNAGDPLHKLPLHASRAGGHTRSAGHRNERAFGSGGRL